MRHFRAFNPSLHNRINCRNHLIFIAGNLHWRNDFLHHSSLKIVYFNRFRIVNIFNLDISVSSVDNTASVTLRKHRSVNCRHFAVGILKHYRLLGVNACFILYTFGRNANDIVTKYHRGKIQRVNAQIKQRPATEL